MVYQLRSRIPDKYFVKRGLREAVVLQQLLGSTILQVPTQIMKKIEYFFQIEIKRQRETETQETHRQIDRYRESERDIKTERLPRKLILAYWKLELGLVMMFLC